MKITRGDKILVGVVLLINLVSIPFVFIHQKVGATIIIEQDNRLIGKFSLAKEQLISVEGKLGITDIEIKDNQARIIRSPCLHKVCVKMGWVRHEGKITACIPNKVVVRVLGENPNGLDAVVG